MSIPDVQSWDHFPENLRLLRGTRSQAEFSRFLGIKNQQTYQRYESGERTPNGKMLYHIANVLGVSVEQLLSESGPNKIEASISVVREQRRKYGISLDEAVRVIADKFDLEKEEVLRAIADAKAKEMK